MINALCIVYYGGFLVIRSEIGCNIGQEFPHECFLLAYFAHSDLFLGKLALRLLCKIVDRLLDLSYDVDRTC